MNEGRRLVIAGRVQGVGYRYTMLREAHRLGATGWVRNCRDGTVEAMVAGTPEVIAAMIAWARTGPPGAHVDAVQVEFADADFTDFVQTSSV